jgi:hypothetical protein
VQKSAKDKHRRPLPKYVREGFEAYLKCVRLEHGFLRVRGESCHAEKLVAFSCKRRAFCPSCGARRMAETAAHLVDDARVIFRSLRDGVAPDHRHCPAIFGVAVFRLPAPPSSDALRCHAEPGGLLVTLLSAITTDRSICPITKAVAPPTGGEDVIRLYAGLLRLGSRALRNRDEPAFDRLSSNRRDYLRRSCASAPD